jgi:hypothetical protein
MRRILVTAISLGVLLAAAVPMARPAKASQIFLDGGAGCTGFGDTWIFTQSYTRARTNGCEYSNRYIGGAVKFQSDGEWGYCGFNYQSFNRTCETYEWVVVARTYHGLCYAWCTDLYLTEDYW